MRRLVSMFCLAMLAVCSAPVPAHAYFWEWLDSLSGPEYRGFTVEWKVYCQKPKTDARLSYLKQLRPELLGRAGELRMQLLQLTDAQRSSKEGSDALVEAVRVSELSVAYVDRAILVLQQDPRAGIDELVKSAMEARLYALKLSAWALVEMSTKTRSPRPPAPLFQAPDDVKVALGGGLSISLCDLPQGQRERQFLNINVGWGVDVKDYGADFENVPEDHSKIFTFGASYHAVVAPYLTVGAGAGVARFSSVTRPAFNKLYVQALILDFRPGGMFPGYPDRWWNAFYLRGTGLIFPSGFELGRFGRQREQYPAEFVKTVGIHAELGTLLKSAQGWKNKNKEAEGAQAAR